MENTTLMYTPDERDRRAWQAIVVWGVFIVLLVIANGTIPFVLGVDVHAWTYSKVKSVVFDFVFYAVLFMVVPLFLTKGWTTVRQPAFLLLLLVAVLGITLQPFVHFAPALVVIVLAYLHWHYDLADLGFRSRGWRGDVLAILLFGLLSFATTLLQPGPHIFTPGSALLATLNRLFANPASTTENLFYFGFLTERLLYKTGKWFTPLLIAAMYTTHEMTNPEYWYGRVSFVLILVGVVIIAAIYLWRRSVVVTWLSDGLRWFVIHLF